MNCCKLMSKGSQAIFKTCSIRKKKRNAKFRVLQEKRKTQSCIEFFDDNNISFFSKLNLFFRSIFAFDKNATPNFVCGWLFLFFGCPVHDLARTF